jgi:hypothetical protein
MGRPKRDGKMARDPQQHGSGVGTGVDVFGGPVVDPTKNVLDLVKAESKYQDAMREAGEKLRQMLADAESRRLDDLAALRLQYEARIAEDLRVGVKTTSEQLAAQLVKETTSLSNLIGALRTEFTGQIAVLTTSFANQIAALTSALTPRMAELERFRWESGGKTSVSDPATSDALGKMAQAIDRLSLSNREHQGKEAGANAVWGQLAVGVGLALTAAAIFFRHG